ncbi:MAG TPA: tryptophanase [Candidatus Binatia bacterium]|nr:tryptophanase [Candidatus Binatia bacterium]
MNDDLRDAAFSVPYEIAVARPLRQTTLSEREEALRAAHYNTELISQGSIYVDLSTDSGVSALSTNQWAALTSAKSLEPGMGLAAEGSGAFALLAEQIAACFGFTYFIPTTQGRSAERIWAKLNVKPNSVVAGNMLFPSTRIHIEMNGAKIIDVIGDAAHDLTSVEPFKGNVDLKKLETVLHEQGAEKLSCVYIELSVNSCGGHPVSLANLREVKALAGAEKVPLFLDACRILENSYLIQEREAGYQGRTIREIALETCALADACTMSALKDFLVSSGGLILTRDRGIQQRASMQCFLDGVQPTGSVMTMMATALAEIFSADAYVRSRAEQVKGLWRRLKDRVPVLSPAAGHAVFLDVKKFLPHLAAEQFPAEALAAFLYRISGIRVTKGPPLAPSQVARGTDLLRLAVPARKYLPGHLDDAATAVIQAFDHRSGIKGLKRVEDPNRSKYEPAHFIPL